MNLDFNHPVCYLLLTHSVHFSFHYFRELGLLRERKLSSTSGEGNKKQKSCMYNFLVNSSVLLVAVVVALLL